MFVTPGQVNAGTPELDQQFDRSSLLATLLQANSANLTAVRVEELGNSKATQPFLVLLEKLEDQRGLSKTEALQELQIAALQSGHPEVLNLLTRQETSLLKIRTPEHPSLSGSVGELKLYLGQLRNTSLAVQLGVADREEKKLHETLTKGFASLLGDLPSRSQIAAAEFQKFLPRYAAYEGGSIAGVETVGSIIDRHHDLASGFSRASDFPIADEVVSEFLYETFGTHGLLRAGFLGVKKFQQYLALLPTDKEDTVCKDLQGAFDRAGTHSSGNFIVTADRNTYLELAKQLEGVSNPEQLAHRYHYRALDQLSQSPSQIPIFLLVDEQARDFDYLPADSSFDEATLMRAYILGLVCHEIAHRLEDLNPGLTGTQEYIEIVAEERGVGREKYVSDYALQWDSIREDFAETVRIYATNPAYLEAHFPSRKQFIEQNLPFMKPGLALTFATLSE